MVFVGAVCGEKVLSVSRAVRFPPFIDTPPPADRVSLPDIVLTCLRVRAADHTRDRHFLWAQVNSRFPELLRVCVPRAFAPAAFCSRSVIRRLSLQKKVTGFWIYGRWDRVKRAVGSRFLWNGLLKGAQDVTRVAKGQQGRHFGASGAENQSQKLVENRR